MITTTTSAGNRRANVPYGPRTGAVDPSAIDPAGSFSGASAGSPRVKVKVARADRGQPRDDPEDTERPDDTERQASYRRQSVMSSRTTIGVAIAPSDAPL